LLNFVIVLFYVLVLISILTGLLDLLAGSTSVESRFDYVNSATVAALKLILSGLN
jgi:hypothetical protein